MRTNYVLIDYENVQSGDLSAFKLDHFRIIVFVGARQSKIPFETAAELQQMGSNAEYVKISGTGPNALDFHIAFYIGQFAEKDPEAHFHIVSKDAGFDPLLNHLKTRKLHAFRVQTVRDIPLLKTGNPTPTADRVAVIVNDLHKRGVEKPRKLGALHGKTARDTPPLKAGNAKSTADRIKVIVDDLHKRGKAKPRTMTTLTSTIGALFRKQLSPEEVGALLTALQARRYVSVVGNKVSYSLPT
ncbi:MAG: PIN domain-containing protein [Pyrinomonadaceae bacterium]|nr:PIN domain-containing protein [Pyrinomonadaceae bacterium]